MAGNKGKKSVILSRDGPAANTSIPRFIELAEITDVVVGGDERYSVASSFNVVMGMDPLRWACSSALGIRRRNSTCDGLSVFSARAAGPEMSMIAMN